MSSAVLPVQFRPNIDSTTNDIILKELFGSDGDVVNKTVKTISTLPHSELDSYELEIRFGTNGTHTTSDQWKTFMSTYSDKLLKMSYSDSIIANRKPNLSIRNVYFRHNTTINTYEKKLVIFKTIQSGNALFPATLKLSKEFPLSYIEPSIGIINIQREQRCSYTFDSSKFVEYDPYDLLSNWRIDMTLRLFSDSFSSTKNTVKLDASNMDTLRYYDVLDIEFEYIGDYRQLQLSINKLAEIVFKTTSRERIIFNMIYSDILPQQSAMDFDNRQLLLSSNDINRASLSKYTVSDEITGDACYIITFTNIKSRKPLCIYALFKTELRHIWYDAKQDYASIFISSPTNIDFSCYQAVYDGSYTLTDVYIHNSASVYNIKFELRTTIIQNSLSSINACKRIFKAIKLIQYDSWSDVISKINPNKSLMFKVKNAVDMNGVLYVIPGIKNLSIKFRVHYIPIKGVYYLYVHGCVSQILRSLSILNRYSIEHTGYAIVGANPSMYYDILFDSPFLENCFYYEPTIDNDTDIEYDKSIVQRMISNPTSFDSHVIKMTYYNNKWYPIKVSSSKPSTYVESIKLSSLIKRYYSIDQSSQDVSNVPPNICDLFGKIHEVLDKFIYETMLNNRNNEAFIDVISYSSYNAKFVKNIANVVTLYVISNTTHLVDDYIAELMFAQPLSPTFIERHAPRADTAFINTNMLTCSFNDIIAQISRSSTYTPGSINTIFYQEPFSSFESLIDIITFRNICTSLLLSNGSLIMKLYDSNRIHDTIENKTTCLNVSFVQYTQVIQSSLEPKITFEELYEAHESKSPKARPKIVTGDTVDVSYSGWKCCGPKPQQQSNSKLLGLLVLYYNHHNLYSNSTFVSRKILTRSQTINIKHILGINTEYSTNAYDCLLDNWYSEYDDVDRAFGSKGKPSSCDISSTSMLIESELLSDDLIDRIVSLKHTNHSIVIATLDELSLPEHFYHTESDNDVHLYIQYAKWLAPSDVAILDKYIQAYVSCSTSEMIYEFYTHPIIDRKPSSRSQIRYSIDTLNGEWFNDIMLKQFKVASIECPMANNSVIKHIALNKQYTNLNVIEDYFKSISFVEFKPL